MTVWCCIVDIRPLSGCCPGPAAPFISPHGRRCTLRCRRCVATALRARASIRATLPLPPCFFLLRALSSSTPFACCFVPGDFHATPGTWQLSVAHLRAFTRRSASGQQFHTPLPSVGGAATPNTRCCARQAARVEGSSCAAASSRLLLSPAMGCRDTVDLVGIVGPLALPCCTSPRCP